MRFGSRRKRTAQTNGIGAKIQRYMQYIMYTLCIDIIRVVQAPTMFKKTFPMSWKSIDDGYAEKHYYPSLEIIIYYTKMFFFFFF